MGRGPFCIPLNSQYGGGEEGGKTNPEEMRVPVRPDALRCALEWNRLRVRGLAQDLPPLEAAKEASERFKTCPGRHAQPPRGSRPPGGVEPRLDFRTP